MSEQQTLPNHIRRLNPFLFPSDTDFRFLLLVVAVVGTSLFIFGLLYNAAFSTQIRQIILDCIAQSPSTQLGDAIPQASTVDELRDLSSRFSEWSTANRAQKACMEGWEFAQGLTALVGTALVLLAAVGVYWATPAVKLRRQSLVPLTSDDAADVLVTLNELCTEADLRTAPTFVWNPLDARPGGQAFGHLRRKYVALSGGLVSLFYSEPAAFRAMVLHELSHLRNGDVDKTYFSLAIWPAFVLIALLPLGVIQLTKSLSSGDLVFLAQLAWRIVGLAILIVLLRNAILRARELYADVRASVWTGPAGALQDALASLSGSTVSGVKALFQKHPSAERRIASVKDTHTLFTTSSWDAFATGVAAALAYTGVFWVAVDLLPVGVEIIASTVAVLVLGPLVAGIICLAVWRDVFAGTYGRITYLRYFNFALALAAGMVMGRWLGATSAIQDDFAGATTSPLSALVFFIWWGLWLAIGLYIFMLAVADAARAWLDTAHGTSSLRRLARGSLIVAAIGMTLWLGLAFVFLSLSDAPMAAITLFAVALFSGSPFVGIWNDVGGWINLALFVGMWALPLAVVIWQRQSPQAVSEDGRWAYLDEATSTGAGPQLAQVQFRVKYAVRAGLVAGALCVLVLVLSRFGMRAIMDEATRSSDDTKLSLMYGVLIGSAVAQAVTAVIVAGRVKELKLSHGLFAAFIAGLTIVLGFSITNVALFEGSFDATFLETLLLQIVNSGAWLTLPLLGALVGISKSRRRTTRPQELPAQPQTSTA